MTLVRVTSSIDETAPAATGPNTNSKRPQRPARRLQPPVTRRKMVPTRLASFALPILAACLLVAAWQIYVSAAHIDPTVLPGPWRVARQGWLNRSDLWTNTVPTLEETLIGFLISIIVSWLIAIGCDFSRNVRKALEPLLVVSQTIPIIAIAPLFVIWFGFTTLPKALIVALVTFFPITISLISGLDTTPIEATNLLRSMGAGKIRRFTLLRVPTSLPFFFSGLRISITYAIVGAIFGEYVGAEKGLGIYMQISQNARRPDLVLDAVFVSAVVSLLLYFLVANLERLLLPYNKSTKGQDEI